MTLLKKSLCTLAVLTLVSSQVVFAFENKETVRYFNGPTVTSIDETSAQISLSPAVLKDISEEDKAGIYFEYGETNQVCIMIYPTPEYCLPKKTSLGSTTAIISNLKPNTSYTVYYKKDNTIRCITTPCPENGFVSQSLEFVTKGKSSTDDIVIKRSLWIGSSGDDVTMLQKILIQEGYLNVKATGYFGGLTMQAVRKFQKDNNIAQLGIVGPLTKNILNTKKIKQEVFGAEKFEGTITAFSTQCFADGICSITVDGKTIITTRGWSQDIVGAVKGIPDFGSIENNIGSHAKVYAKKTEGGYTLYGNADYYVDITPKSGKLSGGSAAPGDSKNVQAHTWVWQKTVMSDNTIVTPNKAGTFTVTFDTEGNLSGKTDCNGFFGGYTFGSDGFIKFGPLGSTLMFCEDSQEQVFTGAIAKVDRYSFDASGNLMLLLSGNAGTIYFTKK